MLGFAGLVPTLAALLVLSIRPLNAQVASGSDWELIRSVHGYGGGNFQSGDYDLAFTIHDGYLGVSSMTGTTDTLMTGYLSVIPSKSTTVTSSPPAAIAGAIQTGGITSGVSGSLAIPLSFSAEISTTVLTSNIQVTRIMDSSGNDTSTAQIFTVVYSSNNQRYELSPTAAWPKGTLIKIYVPTDIKDINGVALPTSSTYYFYTQRDSAADNVARFFSEPTLSVSIPANTFSGDYTIVMSSGLKTDTVKNAEIKLKSSLGDDRKVLKTVQIDPYDSNGLAFNGSLGRNIELKLPYADADGDGIIDGTDPPIRVKSVAVWTLDETDSLWVKQPNSSVDHGNKLIAVSMNHFTIDGLIGALDTEVQDAYAFPVPFRPNAHNAARFGSWEQGIRFTNLPAAGNIRIYSVSGTLVRDMPITTNPQTWDVKNTQGQRVASGLYLWEIVSKPLSNKKKGRLVIIE